MTKAANKRKRKVGQGMKPRVVLGADVSSVSADAGQTQVVSEPQTGVEVGTQTGDTLEAENVQNLESPVGVENPLSVAQVGQGEAPEVVTTNLEDLMRDSVDAMSAETLERAKQNHPLMVTTGPSIAEIEDLMSRRGSENVRLEPNGEVIVTPVLGQQADGTFKMVVTIAEGYIDPIKEVAEGDRITPEEWINTRLQEIMDTWWQRAESR